MIHTDPIHLYGIPNCDTVKRARAWLAEHAVAVVFHDLKREPPTPDVLQGWMAQVPWATLVNRQGTTWRKLDAAVQQGVTDARSAQVLMQAQPSVIKRPVVVWHDGRITVGFVAADWSARMLNQT
jgi:arsenate reductase (glutaredoxin)